MNPTILQPLPKTQPTSTAKYTRECQKCCHTQPKRLHTRILTNPVCSICSYLPLPAILPAALSRQLAHLIDHGHHGHNTTRAHHAATTVVACDSLYLNTRIHTQTHSRITPPPHRACSYHYRNSRHGSNTRHIPLIATHPTTTLMLLPLTATSNSFATPDSNGCAFPASKLYASPTLC